MALNMKAAKKYIFHAVFLIIGILWVYPVIWAVTSSVKTTREMYSGSIQPWPEKFAWSQLWPTNWKLLGSAFEFGNYKMAWYVADFQRYFINTIVFTTLVVLLILVMCMLTGYVLGRYSFPGKYVFIALISATMFIPHGYTIIPIWQLINFLGLTKSIWGLVLAEAGGTHVLYILLFMAYFAGIPKEMEESSLIDGAGFVRTFTVIMLPLAKPVIATTVILQMIHTWNSFFIPLVFTVHRPDLRTLGVGIYSFVKDSSSDLAGMAAGVTISFIPIILVFIFFQRYFVEGIAGAVKG
jgi:multiple sugar transport system permease protein